MISHPSYAFPSEVVLYLELALAALFGAMILARSRRLLPLAATWDSWLGRLSARPRRMLLVAGLLTMLANALLGWIQGPPVPDVADEHSYLLAADTYARGRLSNPPAQPPASFDTHHVLVEPRYASKYPPAQGVVLAVGQALTGRPDAGLWLSAGLLVASAAWMLLAYLPPRWALAGTLWIALHLGLGSYWNQSYWGGSMAALGGALVWGAVGRLSSAPRAWHSLPLALGALVLANSRPLEGLLASLPAALLILWRFLQQPRAWLPRLLPGVLVLLLGTAAMLSHNRAVTGDPLLMPYQLHERDYGIRPLFVFQELRPEPEYRHSALRAFQHSYAKRVDQETPWPQLALQQGVDRLARMLRFMLGLPLLIVALLGFAWMQGDRSSAAALRPEPAQAGRALHLLPPVVLVAAVHATTHAWWPHYAAPITLPLLALALLGLRQVQWRLQRRNGGGQWVLPLLILGEALLFAVQLPAQRHDPEDPARWRQRLVAELEALPGKDLVIVRNPAPSASEWVYNGANLDTAEVLWARDNGKDNAALVDRYPNRRVWMVGGPGAERPPRLQPWQEQPRE